ncbi:hypothetical protein [Brevirhabdus sp.]|uniref:hypothetical protein n=1 Tax=Brevirhabdus sp. TaxID=2004514 RepID=UPI004058BA70
MKKILAGGLIAALTVLPVSGAMAEQIQPLNTTKSTQGADSLQLGTLGAGGVITAAAIIIGIGVIVAGNNSNGTN